MPPLVAQIALSESLLLGAGLGALFVTVAIARAWSRDSRRWERLVRSLRADNHALRAHADELFRRNVMLRAELERARAGKPPGDSPGPAAGGPGPQSGS